MSLYKTIWSPDGEPFEVSPEHANDLVLNKGWFNSKPEPSVEEEPADVVGDDEAPKPVQKMGKPAKPLKKE